MTQSIESLLAIIKRGTVQVIPEAELYKKLKSGKPLKIKLGMDPTAPDLHLGHAIVLKKLREFQDMGHEIILLIGDFTARIGDPTGKSKTRPPLDPAIIEFNQQTYIAQAGRILDKEKLTIVYNSDWLSKLNCSDLVKLCAKVTVARILEREDFKNRMLAHESIGFHELLYPLLQGYDSVVLKADIELGGTDQTFNLLMGRFLQEQFNQEPQVILTMPLLEGIDGTQKMSKSLGNTIALDQPATQAFGQLMSISDELIFKYALLLGNYSEETINQLKNEIIKNHLHPFEAKKDIAQTIIAQFWSKEAAEQSRKSFEAVFQEKNYEQTQPFYMPSDISHEMWIVELLKLIGAAQTSSQAKRLIEGKAVTVDNQLITEFQAKIKWHKGTIIKAGKHRIYKIM